MNVFGQRERSWRKSRKRGVSPIIATILLVAITVVLAAVLYVLIAGLTHGPGSTPLGTAFGWGSPTNATSALSSTCTAANGIGITAKYCYTIQIEPSGSVSTNQITFALRGAVSGATIGWPAVTILTIGLLSPTSTGDVATYNPATSTWSLVSPFTGVLSEGMTLVIGVASGATATSLGQGGLLNIDLEAVGGSGYSGVVTTTSGFN